MPSGAIACVSSWKGLLRDISNCYVKSDQMKSNNTAKSDDIKTELNDGKTSCQVTTRSCRCKRIRFHRKQN